jgi:hypothetical protein
MDNSNTGYAWEILYLAVRSLASSDQSPKERLIDAYNFHLRMLKVHEIPWSDLKTEIATIFIAIENLNDCNTSDTIHKITELYDKVTRRQTV